MNMFKWAIPVLALTIGSMSAFTACRSAADVEKNQRLAEGESIPYEVMHNYFLKNNVNGISYPLITNDKEFQGLFGMATAMGENGRPTPVDFSKEFIVAVVLPETNVSTEIIPLRMVKNEKEVKFLYKVKRGEKMSYRMLPVLLVKVNNEYRDEVVLEEVKNEK